MIFYGEKSVGAGMDASRPRSSAAPRPIPFALAEKHYAR